MGATDTTGHDLWSDIRPDSARRILVAALECFGQNGYGATTTREIAQRARMSPAAVYVHYQSKADLLGQLALRGHEAVLELVDHALAEAHTPTTRLHRLVENYARWHVDEHMLGRVLQYELASIEPEVWKKIAPMRRTVEQRLATVLETGVADKAFAVDDVESTTLAILSLCIDISRWWARSRRRRDGESLAKEYADLAVRMVRA